MSRRGASRATVHVEHVMGTAASIHVRTVGRPDGILEAAIAASIDRAVVLLHEVDRTCSTYDPASDVSRIRAGVLAIDDAHPVVREIAAASDAAELATGGLVSSTWDGRFDPTCIAKGWAVERATRRALVPLLEHPRVLAVGIGAGGDMQLATAPGADWSWRVGVVDPATPGTLVATLEVVDGAVATSGTAERGAHVVDPRTGEPMVATASATVVADSLAHADAWATAALIRGVDDLAWIGDAGLRSGVVVGADGRIRRFAGDAEVVAHDAELLG